MIIQNPDPITRTIDDYELHFTNGQSMSIEVDAEAGDTTDFTTHPLAILIHLETKPSRTSPNQMMGAEDLTIFLSHILSIVKRQKTVTPLTFEQKMEWTKTVNEISRTIQ